MLISTVEIRNVRGPKRRLDGRILTPSSWIGLRGVPALFIYVGSLVTLLTVSLAFNMARSPP